jgi:glycine cleavage system pyridoxal-binding protein P
MLDALGVQSMESLIDATIPNKIMKKPMEPWEPMTETDALDKLKEMMG